VKAEEIIYLDIHLALGVSFPFFVTTVYSTVLSKNEFV
jgi:hypothetical protein